MDLHGGRPMMARRVEQIKQTAVPVYPLTPGTWRRANTGLAGERGMVATQVLVAPADLAWLLMVADRYAEATS